jgi:hypothetical protein
MSAAGVWLTVKTIAGSCSPPRTAGAYDSRAGKQTVSTRFGDVALVYGDAAPPGAERASFARAAVHHPSGCTSFEFVALEYDTLKAALPTAGRIVSSINEPVGK